MMRCLLLLPVVLGLAAAAQAEEIHTIEESFEATITAIPPDAAGTPVVQTSAKSVPLPLVRRITFNDRSKVIKQRSATIILTNGDRLRGQVTGGDDEGLQLRTASLGNLTLPLLRLRAIIVDPDLDMREAEKRLLRENDTDIVFLRSGSEAAGTLTKVTDKAVSIDVSGAGALSIDLEKVGMILLSVLDEPKVFKGGTLVRLKFLDESSLSGRFVSLAEGQVTFASQLSDKTQVRTTDIFEMSVLNGAFVYLSDLEPSKVLQKFDGFTFYPDIYGWKRDRSVMGGVLKLGGRSYEKGLGVHSYTALTYELGEGFEEFRAVIGLDDSVRFLGEPGLGSVRFRVLVDGEPYKDLAEGILLDKSADPKRITIKVAGAKSLTLIADYGPMLHILGRANWADAHLIRKAP